jgi:hypothetical protein
MLGCIDCSGRGDLGVIISGVSLNFNEPWTEGLEIFSFLLAVLGTVGLGLLVGEEVECDSSLVSGGGDEAGMFCAGEDMPLSQLVALFAVG